MLARTIYLVTGFVAVGLLASVTMAQDKADNRAARAFQILDANNDGAVTLEEYRRGVKKSEADHAERNFKRVDKDNDGKVTARELRAEWAIANNVLRSDIYDVDPVASARVQDSAFVAIDTDKDDSISREELLAAAREKAEHPAQTFHKADMDNNGKLTRKEFTDSWKPIRAMIKDRYVLAEKPENPAAASTVDGPAPKETKKPADGEKPEPAKPNDEGDDDGADGKGGKDGRGPNADGYFTELDANGNGQLTLAEFRAGVSAKHSAEAEKHFKKMDRNNDGAVARGEFQSGWVHGKRQSDKSDKGDKGKGNDQGQDKKG